MALYLAVMHVWKLIEFLKVMSVRFNSAWINVKYQTALHRSNLLTFCAKRCSDLLLNRKVGVRLNSIFEYILTYEHDISKVLVSVKFLTYLLKISWVLVISCFLNEIQPLHVRTIIYWLIHGFKGYQWAIKNTNFSFLSHSWC